MKAHLKNKYAVELLQCMAIWDISPTDATDIVRLMADALAAGNMPKNPLEGTGLTADNLPEFAAKNVLRH